MKVWNHSWISNEIKENILYSGEIFTTRLTDFFKSRSYGTGVEEIFYMEVCESPVFTPNKLADVLRYSKRKKYVEIGLKLDFSTAEKLDVHQFARYLANTYIDQSESIQELMIVDFDLNRYISDLVSFFMLYELI